MHEEHYSVRPDETFHFINLVFRSNFGISPSFRYCRNCGCLAFVFPVNEEAKRLLVQLGYTVHDFKPLYEKDTKKDVASGKTDS